MANHKTGAQRYNDRMDDIMSRAHANEKERLAAGEKPNPSLTSPEEARKHGWEIKDREVSKIKKHDMAHKMKPIHYYTKSVYGLNKNYIHDPEIAHHVSSLTNQKTLDQRHIDALKALGHKVEHRPKY